MSGEGHAIYLRFDDAFLPFARACLNSLRENFPGHPRLIVDYHGENAPMSALLDAMGAELLDPEPAPEFAQYLKGARTGEAVADRFKLFRSGFNRFGTILHLDADMLVLKPLDDLFEKPDPFFVANHEPTPDVRIFRSPAPPELRKHLDTDGLPLANGSDDMANAGLFTLPARIRTPETIAQLARMARRYGPFFAFADQSLLSLWHLSNGHRPTLNLADNFQTPFFTAENIGIGLDDIRVLHFSSTRKPGTFAFDRWERVGPQRPKLIELFQHYRDLPL